VILHQVRFSTLSTPAKEQRMPYRIAGIDVHKKMLAVVIADVAVEGEYAFEPQRFGATESELRRLADWFLQCEVQEAVMESTAQYWRPVWAALKQYWKPAARQREGAGRRQASCIWLRLSPTVERAAVRTIFVMQNEWYGGWWLRN
jgi:hypothetical protein